MSLRNRLGAFFFVLTFVIACPYAFAEQTTTDSVCATPDARSPVITSFSTEHAIDLSEFKITIPLLPEVNASIADALSKGNEIRSQVIYNRETDTMENNLFVVEAGAPLPTDPNEVDIPAVRFAFIKVHVNKVYTSCRPLPHVIAVGRILDGAKIFQTEEGEGLFPEGGFYSFAFGYTTDTPTQFRGLVSTTVGIALLYQAQAPGSITFKPPHD